MQMINDVCGDKRRAMIGKHTENLCFNQLDQFLWAQLSCPADGAVTSPDWSFFPHLSLFQFLISVCKKSLELISFFNGKKGDQSSWCWVQGPEILTPIKDLSSTSPDLGCVGSVNSSWGCWRVVFWGLYYLSWAIKPQNHKIQIWGNVNVKIWFWWACFVLCRPELPQKIQ